MAMGTASAQRLPFNEAGVTMGHWHLNSQNVEANKKLLVTLGGKAIKPGDFEIVIPRRQRVPASAPRHAGAHRRQRRNDHQPRRPAVPNVQESFTKWKAAGVSIEYGKERTDQAWITTVDGLRIEILEDKSQTVPIKHHHVHFHLAEQPSRRSRPGTAKALRRNTRECADATVGND